MLPACMETQVGVGGMVVGDGTGVRVMVGVGAGVFVLVTEGVNTDTWVIWTKTV